MESNADTLYIDALGMVMPRIERAPIRLNLLEMNNVFSTFNTALSGISSHYKSRLIRQGMKVLGYADFLGNPISVLSSLGQGVKDFFVEPRDALLHGKLGWKSYRCYVYSLIPFSLLDPSQVHKGLYRGTASLLRNTVKGVTTFGSTVTGTFNSGLAHLTFDSAYRARREKENSARPENIGQGIAQGYVII